MIYPPVWVLIGVPPVTYAALIFIFAVNKTESGPAYLIYFMSAYSLVILTAQLPYMAGRIRRLKLFIINKSRLVYIHDIKIFIGRRGLPQNDECSNRRLCVWSRYSYCCIYADTYCRNKKEGDGK